MSRNKNLTSFSIFFSIHNSTATVLLRLVKLAYKNKQRPRKMMNKIYKEQQSKIMLNSKI